MSALNGYGRCIGMRTRMRNNWPYCIAGAVPELNRNRIFARWLQKKVVFTSEDGGTPRGEPVKNKNAIAALYKVANTSM